MNKVLWSGLTLEITNALESFYSSYVSVSGHEDIIAQMILDSMLIHNSNGDHVYYDTAATFASRLKYYAAKTIPIIQGLTFDDDNNVCYIKIPDPKDTISKTFGGDNYGMTELSPLNATIGNITTPNSKSNYHAENEENSEFVNFSYFEKMIKIRQSDYANLMNYFHSVFVHLIVEYNTIM